MKNNKCYLVIYSRGSYEDYREIINDTVFTDYSFAVNKQIEIEDYHKEDSPFPFDWCTEEDFLDLWREDKAVNEDVETFLQWEDENNNKGEFNKCWIKELILK